ncbi:unnamed protein product [Chrysoparadoxa australica]
MPTFAAGGKRRGKVVVDLSLFVNGINYEFGKECDFCCELPATHHCPDERCGFVCDNCDAYRHKNDMNKEYQTHVRTKMSRFDVPTAGAMIQRFMRYMHLRRLLREECRRQYTRLYDPGYRVHYYCFNRTGERTWHKPYVLGNEELRPFLTEEEAAFKMQQLHRNWRAREVVRDLLRAQWDRIFLPAPVKRFYYYYNGSSPLIPEPTKWEQPFKGAGGPWIWRPLLTRDMAALRIQNTWKSWLALRGLRNLIRQVYTEEHDPATGATGYRHNVTGALREMKPTLLGSERWDMTDAMQWNVEEVIILLRRCGLKRHVASFRKYNVDGALLLTFDPEDFECLGVLDPIHIKKILLTIEHLPGFKGYNNRPKDLLRRTALRQRHLEHAKADAIQRWWKGIFWRQLLKAMRYKRSVDRRNRLAEEKRKKSAEWWTSRSYAHTGFTGVKDFGARKWLRGVQGWGAWTADGTWVAAPEGYDPDAHHSREW